MIRLLLSATVASALALALVACGDDDDSDDGGGDAAGGDTAAMTAEEPAATAEPATEAQSAAPGTQIKLADSEFGQILFDSKDQAIYLFEKETGPKSECYGACAEAWPPVLTKGEPAAGNGVKAGLLGTTERNDGTTQVTYNGHPLYYYHDEGPGEVLCHNVAEFGALWKVLDGAGNPLA